MRTKRTLESYLPGVVPRQQHCHHARLKLKLKVDVGSAQGGESDLVLCCNYF